MRRVLPLVILAMLAAMPVDARQTSPFASDQERDAAQAEYNGYFAKGQSDYNAAEAEVREATADLRDRNDWTAACRTSRSAHIHFMAAWDAATAALAVMEKYQGDVSSVQAMLDAIDQEDKPVSDFVVGKCDPNDDFVSDDAS